MRLLQNKPNVEAPSADYPYGRIKDNTGANDGTPVSELVYGDFHQFFERLMALGGITANNQPEGDVNGFQLVQALKAYVDSLPLTNGIVKDSSLETARVKIATGTAQLTTKVLDIGAWNMDTTASVTIDLSPITIAREQVKMIFIKIYSDPSSLDAGRTGFDLIVPNYSGGGGGDHTAQGSVHLTEDENIILYRKIGGTFDSAEFDDAAINRGEITIVYA